MKLSIAQKQVLKSWPMVGANMPYMLSTDDHSMKQLAPEGERSPDETRTVICRLIKLKAMEVVAKAGNLCTLTKRGIELRRQIKKQSP